MEYTDNEIIEGLRNRDCQITREYFYGYCHLAYYIYNNRYGLTAKSGLDFYSIAHEYYLKLAMDNFRQLDRRDEGLSLKTWMTNGFRFIVLDRLKSYSRHHKVESIEERLEKPALRFDIADSDYASEVRTVVEDVCNLYYRRDNKTSIVLKMILVEGFKGKEVAAQLGMTPAAVTQRYRKAMTEVLVPYFKSSFEMPYSNYSYGAAPGASAMEKTACPPPCFAYDESAEIHSPNHKNLFAMEKSETRPQRITPQFITELKDNEIFVFGSNLAGMHGGGAARTARLHFGAVMGQGVGLQGHSYAIPTMQGGVDTIRPYVDEFIDFARSHPELTFLVTPIGCGIAGFSPDEIAPLFAHAQYLSNVALPECFWDEL